MIPSTARRQRQAFLRGYIRAALWANTVTLNEDGEPTDDSEARLDPRHLAWGASVELVRDARNFYEENLDDLRLVAPTLADERNIPFPTDAWDELGHLFALNRAGHGVGYWDRGFGDAGDRLSSAAKVYGDQVLVYDPATSTVGLT